MPHFDWEKAGSPLQRALKQALTDGTWGRAFADLRDYTVSTRNDALALSAALESHLQPGRAISRTNAPGLHELASMLQKIESAECDAFEVVREHALPHLAAVVQQHVERGDPDYNSDVLFLLKILALYASPEGLEALVEAGRRSFDPDNFMWSVILDIFIPEHPEATRILGAMGEPLPSGFIAIALLDAANRFFLEGGEMRHPFDSDAGVARLKALLDDPDPEHASYAASATVALPFLNHDAQSELLRHAMNHPSADVALEGAWAAARLDEPRGIEALASFCRNLHQSAKARNYLEELERTDAIPAEALDPDFIARAEFASWLAHPDELGHHPDEIDILDRRELPWPPSFELRPLWLLRFRTRTTSELDEDDVGIGLVGGTTWCFFGFNLDQRPPEDAYALHGCWEMEQAALLQVSEVDKDCHDYDGLLDQWKGGPLENPAMEDVAELGPEVPHPRRLLGVAAAALDGDNGWVVLDGPKSRWYPAAGFPPGETGGTLLRLHLGRAFLGLGQGDNRSRWLKPPAAPAAPERIVTAYERLLDRFPETLNATAAVANEAYRQLDRHFESYVDQLTALRGGSREDHLPAAYARLFELATRAENLITEQPLDTVNALGHAFPDFVDALLARGQCDEVRRLVGFLLPRWQGSLGYGYLGTAAFKAGDFDTAETLFLRLQASFLDWSRTEELPLLAEIWCRHRNRPDDARNLLLHSLQDLLQQSSEAAGSDRRQCEAWFRSHRQSFLRLFPDESATLAAHGIPETTLRPR